MANYEAKGARDQGSRKRRRIDVPRFKELVKGRALDIIGKRMKIDGKPTAREVRIINTHRGEKTASASWNAEKGFFCDKGDPSYDGDIFEVVMKCDGVSFAEAMRIVAAEAGVDIQYLDAATATPHANQTKAKPNGSHPSRASTEPRSQQAGAQPDAGTENGDADSDAETPEQKIERARKAWVKGGNVLDTYGEAYLNEREITLAREEPWLRYDEAHPLHVRVDTAGRVPDYQLVGRFPTLIGAATIAGQGDVQAVAKIAFSVDGDGTVDPRPTIIDPRTGKPFKKNKRLRGVMAEAGIFLGQHLDGDAIVITEGIEDALCAVMMGIPGVAKMGAQSLESLKLPAHIKRVILAGDNDEAGQAGVRKAAPVYHERGYTVSIVKLAEGVKDLNQMLVKGGIDAVRDVITVAETWEPAPEQPERDAGDEGATNSGQEADALIEFADDVQLPTNTNYLIKHLLAPGDLGAIYGPPGAGKSFIALHLAGCIALGRQFGGNRTRATPVLYVGLEGEAGMRRRMMALKSAMGAFAKMLARMRPPVQLRQDEAGTLGETLLIDAIVNLRESSGQEVGLVIIDTVWRAMAGDDENSAQDMGKFIARLKRVQEKTGVAVLLVHHSGKDADRGMRGSSSLLGAVDLVMKVDGKVIAVEKNKDGPDGDQIHFELRQVDLGRDDEGDPITSCVVEIQDAGAAREKRRRKRPKKHSAADKALQQLYELIIDGECEKVIGVAGIPDHAEVVKLDVWRERCRRKGLSPGSATDKRDENEARTFRRVAHELEASGWIGITDDKVWIIREDRWRPHSMGARQTTNTDGVAEDTKAA